MIKMELDTRMTPIAYAKDVRNAMKEFKAKYTENDLAMMFRISSMCLKGTATT